MSTTELRPSRRVADTHVAEQRQRYCQPDGDGVARHGEIYVENKIHYPTFVGSRWKRETVITENIEMYNNR